ncbi:MAG: DUF192 domain-containing protein [Patescibacteria group bacterium]
MERVKNIFFLIIGLVIVAWSFYMFLQQPAPAKYQRPSTWRVDGSVLKVGDRSIPVELADTDTERIQGLSGRASLEHGSGLLFLFEKGSVQGFWMKDMKFSIDIVWIDENWTVIGIERSVEPDSYPTVFYSNGPAKYVLELNAGDAATLGIDIASKLSLDR